MPESTHVRAINESEFEALVGSDALVFVDFWAPWCAPCVQFSSVYEKVAQQYPSILFTSVQIEEQPAIAELFEIRSIPHLMVFKQGVAIYSESGSIPESTLKELAEQALCVDMTSLRGEKE
ncbi:MAG: thioredoxin family protein [Legionellaceae bacterium]